MPPLFSFNFSSFYFPLWPWALPLAFLLDAMLGDPSWLPHPVRWIGSWASFLERLFRKARLTGKVAGGFFWLAVVGITALCVTLVCLGAALVHPYVLYTMQVYLLYQGIAMRDLDREARRIHQCLVRNDVEAARVATSRIVSRSTENMDEPALCRSAIESVAENGVDGVLSPLLWILVGGPLGLWIFKAASTLDSMVGYRTERYELFGKVSARMDDVLNWIPARLALLIYALAAIKPSKMLRTLRVGYRDCKLHASPNSGWGEAAMSGFLGARLGGPAVYHGVRKDKPWFGGEFRDACAQDIVDSLRLVWRAALIVVILAVC